MKSALIIGLFAAIAAAVVTLYVRRRNITFEGVVTDKDVQEIANDNLSLKKPATIRFGKRINHVSHQYNIKVQTDLGKMINWQISEGKYQILNIGDHVSKPSGSTDINITPRAQLASLSPPSANQPPQSPNSISN